MRDLEVGLVSRLLVGLNRSSAYYLRRRTGFCQPSVPISHILRRVMRHFGQILLNFEKLSKA